MQFKAKLSTALVKVKLAFKCKVHIQRAFHKTIQEFNPEPYSTLRLTAHISQSAEMSTQARCRVQNTTGYPHSIGSRSEGTASLVVLENSEKIVELKRIFFFF